MSDEPKLFYIVCYRRKHPLGRIETRIHPIPAKTVTEAETMQQTLSQMWHGPSWIVETQMPEFRAPLRLAANNGENIGGAG